MHIRTRPFHLPLFAAMLGSVVLPALAQEMQEIGEVTDEGHSSATGISSDGSTVIGTVSGAAIDALSNSQAFRWTIDGREILGTLRSERAEHHPRTP